MKEMAIDQRLNWTIFIILCVVMYGNGQRNPFDNTEERNIANPSYERSCYECSYVSKAPAGKSNIKISFQGFMDRLEDNDPNCKDPFQRAERTCKADVCMKIERTWHNDTIILRRCADPVRNPCVPKWEEVDWYQRTIVSCCQAQLCNSSVKMIVTINSYLITLLVTMYTLI